MGPAPNRLSWNAVLASAIVGALYGLILYWVLSKFVAFAELAILMSASMVALSVAALSRFQKSLSGDRKPSVWLPTLVGALAGAALGIAILWLQPPVSRILLFLPAGAIAGGLASLLGQVLPPHGGRNANRPK